MRILMTGSRFFSNRGIVEKALKTIQGKTRAKDMYLAQGACAGADAIAADVGAQLWGSDHVREFVPDWKKFGKRSGPIRNQQMVDEFKPDVGVAFIQNGVPNVGTMDCVARMLAAGITVHMYPAPKSDLLNLSEEERFPY